MVRLCDIKIVFTSLGRDIGYDFCYSQKKPERDKKINGNDGINNNYIYDRYKKRLERYYK